MRQNLNDLIDSWGVVFGFILLLAGVVAVLPFIAGPKPFERTCPDRSATDERLAYSTYHSDGRLECTYIPHGGYGKTKRRLVL